MANNLVEFPVGIDHSSEPFTYFPALAPDMVVDAAKLSLPEPVLIRPLEKVRAAAPPLTLASVPDMETPALLFIVSALNVVTEDPELVCKDDPLKYTREDPPVYVSSFCQLPVSGQAATLLPTV